MIVYSQGRYHKESEPAVPLGNSGFLHGHGVFTTLRLYEGQAPFLAAHRERLASHAQVLDLPPPPELPEIESIVGHLVQANNLGQSHARLRITLTTYDHNCFLTVAPGPLPELLTRWSTQGVGVITVGPQFQRLHRPELKTLQFQPSFRALQYAAKEAQCPEAVICTADKTVLEGAISNVFIVREGRLTTTPAEGKILSGLARQRILDLAGREALPWEEEYFRRPDLLAADEVFLTNSVREVLPVVLIDGQQVGPGQPGPVTKKLQKLYCPFG